MSDHKRIPAESLSAYERWELPALGEDTRASRKTSFSGSSGQTKFPTADEIEKIHRSAYKEGFEEGKRKGYAASRDQGLRDGREQGRLEGLEQGRKEGQAQIDAAVASLSKVLAELADPIAHQQEQATQVMLNVAIAIARSVIHRELQLDPDILQTLAAKALSCLPKNAKDIQLLVNPEDMALLSEALKTSAQEISLHTDPTITRGGCLVNSSTQQLDYTVEKRFQKTIQEMLLQLSQKDAGIMTQESPETINEQSEYDASLLDDVHVQANVELEVPEGPAVQPDDSSLEEPDEESELAQTKTQPKNSAVDKPSAPDDEAESEG